MSLPMSLPRLRWFQHRKSNFMLLINLINNRLHLIFPEIGPFFWDCFSMSFQMLCFTSIGCKHVILANVLILSHVSDKL